MKGPTIYVVSTGHIDFNGAEYLAWFFDEDEARAFAAASNRKSEYRWVNVDEVPCGSPMPDRTHW